METKKKRASSLSAALLLAGALALSACSSGNQTVNSTGNTGASDSPEGNQPTAAATLELNWMLSPGSAVENSAAEKYLEDKFNVVINSTIAESSDFAQKQQVLFSSGSVPDVFFVLDPNTLKKYADQGLVAELPMETIEQFAPKTKTALDTTAKQGWFYSLSNGKNYGLPTLYPGRYTPPVAWRTDLLEKAGITQIPQTIDEMTSAFAAVKKLGIYGMSSNGSSYYSAFQKIFGAYGVMPTQWMNKDGKIVNGAVQPEAKAALTLLADWYKKGYIDPEFVTGKDLSTKFIDGKFVFNENASIVDINESDPNSALAAIKKLDPNGKVEFAPLPKGPDGKQGGWAWGTAGNIWAFGKQLEDQPEKLQKALEIIDAVNNDEELYTRLAYGEKGKHWDYTNGTDLQEGIKQLPPYDDNAQLWAEGINGSGHTFFGGTPNLDLFYSYDGEKRTELSNTFGMPAVSDIFGKSDILPSSGKYWADLMKLKTEAYALIIRGDKPVSYFDEFVQEWNKLGGEQLEKEANEFYNSVN